MTYHIQLLGRFELRSPAGGKVRVSSKKNQALIAMVALADGEAVLRNRLCSLLWDDRGEHQARNSLRQAFSALRRTLIPHGTFPFTITEEEAALDVTRATVDALEMMHGDYGVKAVKDVHPKEFLEGLELTNREAQSWLLTERQRFMTLHCDYLVGRIAALENSGNWTDAALAANALLTLDRLDERAHRAIMRAHRASDEPANALRQFQTCRDLLFSELGLAPALETKALANEIRAKSTNLEPNAAQVTGQAHDIAILETQLDKPSIVVLPFVNISGIPDYEYFSDGITEDIITELSRFRDLIVIARNSSFAYKGKSAKAQDVCQELDARYILEGSVQHSADRVRITAQLIDGRTGGHVWVERYDRLLKDVFAVQDEVTALIVSTLASGYGGRLRKAVQGRTARKRPGSFQAFDCLMRGLDLFTFNKDETMRAGALFEEAIRIDPNYSKAYAKLAWVHVLNGVYGWTDDYDGTMAKGLELASKAVACDDSESWAHWALAGYYWYSRRSELALAQLDKAIRLNPSDAEVLTDIGLCMSYAGRPLEGLQYARKALWINKHHPEWYLMQLGQIYYDARQYEDAVSTFESLHTVETALAYLYKAASLTALNQIENAKKALEQAFVLDPASSLKKWTDPRLAPYMKREDLEHFREHLRKAGLPE